MVCLSRSNLAVRVKSGIGEGTIYVREGEIHHAQTENLQGEAAFYEMLRWKDGQFEMLPFQDMGINSMDRSWEYLLLEAMRKKDEQASEQTDEEMDEDPGQQSGTGPEAGELAECGSMDANIDLAFEKYGLHGEAYATLPLDEFDEEPVCKPADPIEPARVLKLLVVDDSPFFARQLKRMLESDPKIRVAATAKNGQEALEYLSTNPAVDLITLDVQMPVMPGESALKHIMVRFGIPVLMISSFHMQSLNDIFEFLQLGAVDFLAKPDTRDDIVVYGELLRDMVKRAARSDVSHFRRLRKSKSDSRPPKGPQPLPRKVLLILGAEGAYMDWFKLPLPQLCGMGLVIGLQKLSDLFLLGFSRLIHERTGALTVPLVHSEWICSGSFFFGNAGHRAKLKYLPEESSLGIEIVPGDPLSWYQGIQSWARQLADQAGAGLSIYFLSAAHVFPVDLLEALLRRGVRLILPPLDTIMCTDLVESISPYAHLYSRQIVHGSPENLMEVWSNHELLE